MNFSKKQLLKLSMGLILGFTTFGVATQAHAAKVSPSYKVKKTVSVTEHMKIDTSVSTYKTAAFWSYPYRSNAAAKKTHWVRNYKNKALVATKEVTLKNGLKYYYVKVASKPAVKGWIYSKNLRQMSYVALGDSITKGWTGSSYAADPYPAQVGKDLGMTTTNLGQNNGKVVGTSSLDLTYNINHHNFKNDDVATIAYGVNDYFHVASLTDVTTTLDSELDSLEKQYPNLQLIGILPLNCYVKDATSGLYVSAAITAYSSHAYTLDDLRDAEASVYKAHHIKVLDWRQYEGQLIPTDDSRTSVFGDNRLHPTQATYNLMSDIISNVMSDNLK